MWGGRGAGIDRFPHTLSGLPKVAPEADARLYAPRHSYYSKDAKQLALCLASTTRVHSLFYYFPYKYL